MQMQTQLQEQLSPTDAAAILERLPLRIQVALKNRAVEIEYPLEAVIEMAIASFLDSEALGFADCQPGRGQVGTVVDILAGGEAFEVEFSARDGRTYESLGLRRDLSQTGNSKRLSNRLKFFRLLTFQLILNVFKLSDRI